MFKYEFSEPHPRGAFTSTGRFEATGIVTVDLVASLEVGESITITRLPDVFYVPVRIVTANGGLTQQTYTYTHSELLPAGAVVEVPHQRWANGPVFGVVQSAGLVEDGVNPRAIVRVV